MYVEISLHLWDEAYLIMVDDLFAVFFDSFFPRILLSTFATLFIRKLACNSLSLSLVMLAGAVVEVTGRPGRKAG